MCGARNRPHQATRDDAAAAVVAVRPAEAPHRSSAVPDHRLRASDAERDAAASELQVHAAAGRLDVDELDERMSSVLSARTRADITAVLDDLPRTSRTSPETTSPDDSREHGPSAYFAVMLLLAAIWLLTGAGHFWPLYPAIGWGLPLLMSRLSAGTSPARLSPASQSGPR